MRPTSIVLQADALLAARHGKGLAGAGLAVGKDGGMEAREGSIQQLRDPTRMQHI